MIKKQFYMGFIGFLGFIALRYFSSGNLLDLGFIGFFAFFSYFLISKISGNKADERYMENNKTAMALTGQFTIIEIFAVWFITMITMNMEVTFVLISLMYAITLNVYAIKLYILEEK